MAEAASPECEASDAGEQVTYTCRACRRVLFTPSDFEAHQVAQQRFSMRKAKGKVTGGLGSCMSYFIAEKLDW
jgi:hypothetical protein